MFRATKSERQANLAFSGNLELETRLREASQTAGGRRGRQRPLCRVEVATVGEIIDRYQRDGYLDKNLNWRSGGTLVKETRNCDKLLKFWKPIPVSAVTDAMCNRYHDWRVSW
jgi:hypothetical protein